MATLVDALVVKVTLDPAGFSAGKKTVDKGLTETGKNFEKVAMQAAKFLAVFGGASAMKNFVAETIESNAALERLSKNLETTVTNISAWSNAAAQAGGSAQGLQGTFDMLNRAQTELMLTGQSALIPYFSALGISIADFQGKARPVDDLLLDLAEKFSKMDRSTANNMGRMMGIDQGTMNLLLRGRAEVEAMISKQKEYNAVTKQQGEESEKLREKITLLEQKFNAIGREITSAAFPALEKVLGVLERFGEWAKNNQSFIEATLTAIAVGIGAIAFSIIRLNPVISTITALGAAMSAIFPGWLKTTIDGIKTLSDVLVDAGFRMAAFLDMTYQFFSGNKKGAKKSAQRMMDGYDKSTEGAGKEKDKGASGNDKLQETIDFFVSKGWSKKQAIGIAANIQAESSFDYKAQGDFNKKTGEFDSYGLMQWRGERQSDFKKLFGKDIKDSSRLEQLEFANYELTAGKEQSAGRALRGATNESDAASIISDKFERPSNAAKESAKRARIARAMALGVPGAGDYAGISGAGAVASSNSVVNSGGNSSNSINIENITVQTNEANAPGIAKDIKGSMEYLFATQNNMGMR